MTLGRFAQICDAYGSNPRAWPVDERDAAQAFAANSAEAQALLAQAALLDEGLAASVALAPSAALLTAILAARPVPLADRSWIGGLREVFSWRPALPALAAALVAGIAVGLWMSADSGDQLDVVQVAMFQNDLEDY
jgi:hypothetical protein